MIKTRNKVKTIISICAIILLALSFVGVQKAHAVTKPSKATITSLSADTPGKLTVKMKRASRASGYQIMYSKKSSFASAKSKYTSSTSTSITELKHCSKYYVKARAYKKSGSKKIYGSWSSAKAAYTQGTKGNPIAGNDVFKVKEMDSTINVQVDNIYVNDEALEFLSSIGEDPYDFERDEYDGIVFRPVVIAMKIKVLKGTFHGYNFGGTLYEPNKRSKMNFICHMLYKNADKDMYGGDAKLKKGKTDIFYCVYGIPEEFTEMSEHYLSEDGDFWVEYDFN